MELRPGYKRTEIGTIPSEWMLTHLGEIGSISAGGTPSRSNPTYWNGDIPWVTTSEVNFGTISEASQSITRDGLANSAARVLPRGTLVMALYGQGKTRGKVAVLGIAAATNQACAAISLKPGVCREFVFHFLASQYHAIRNRSNTGNQENLNGSLVRLIPVALPPHSEQRAIAAALSDVDALLDGLTRLIAKKLDLKHAAMQQLLTGRTRLPGFAAEWSLRRIGDVASIAAGGTPSTRIARYWGGTIRWMSSGELHLKRVNDVAGRITELGLSNSSAVMLPRHCVLIGLAGQGRTRGTVAINGVELCTNQSIAAVLPNPAFLPEFLFYNLDSRYEEIRELSTGSGGRGALNLGIISSIPVLLPPIDEQIAIATVLSDMDAELAALEARHAKTHALKQAMMQSLLTGRIRLVPPKPAHA